MQASDLTAIWAHLATHQVPLDEAPRMYELFQKKQDGCIKVVLKP